MNFKILFEDSDLLVIDKPSGFTVNRSDTTAKEDTIQDLVKEKIDLSTTQDEEFLSRGGIVHRLDRETSGVLIIAKNPTAFRKIQEQFKNREVEKEYIALAHGVLVPEAGEINAPVGRLPWNRRSFGVLAGGREASTRYETLGKTEYEKETLSLVRLSPKTGRTHQIRVHLKHIGHPIFADFLYAGRKASKRDRKVLGRVFLHASQIHFTHPTTLEKLTIKADLPPELQNVLNLLKLDDALS